jgi:hypothetical protein
MPSSLSKVEAFLSALKEQTFIKDAMTQGSVLWYIAFHRSAPRAADSHFARAGSFSYS